jgi:hypothetical protein
MANKTQKTLRAIFANPVLANIAWHDIMTLFVGLGAEVQQAAGSRVWVSLKGVRAVFHEPHPEKEISKPAVRSVREFLINAGIEVEE